MQDAITSVINAADVQGKYLDDSSVEKIKSYFKTGELRVRAAATIAANAATIIVPFKYHRHLQPSITILSKLEEKRTRFEVLSKILTAFQQKRITYTLDQPTTDSEGQPIQRVRITGNHLSGLKQFISSLEGQYFLTINYFNVSFEQSCITTWQFEGTIYE